MSATLAHIRQDIVDAGESPPYLRGDGFTGFIPRSLARKRFLCEQPDELDCEEYNLVLHIAPGFTVRAMSIDFDFENVGFEPQGAHHG